MQMQTAFSKSDNKDKLMVLDKEPNAINYFLPGPSQDNDKKVSAEIIQQLQRDFKDIATGKSCFDGMFSLQVKPDSKPYQAPPKCVAYALWKSFKKESEWLQEQDIITPLGMDETAERCNSFVISPQIQWKN